MLSSRLPRRAPWRVLLLRAPTTAAHVADVSVGTAVRGSGAQTPSGQQLRAFSSSGMDAFMEFEREMAMKRRQNNPLPPAAVRLERPIPPRDDECCKLDCPNCVLLVYQEKLLDYELSLQTLAGTAPTKPKKPEPKYTIAFLDDEPSAEQVDQMRQNDKLLYGIARNELISEPHTTKDGFERSVRHIDLHVADDQRGLIGDDASNIAVFVPNDVDLVERAIAHLRVDPDLVFTVAPLSTETVSTGLHVDRPFETIGSVRDALTWSLDLVSTPRPSFLRHLAAYASDDAEVEALLAPTAIETIQENRPGQRITLVDILEMFPSAQVDFASLYQFAPQNAPRYYTVSSSRRLYPDTVSITLGLRKLASQPTPRCSSYLSSLEPGVDNVRATFFKSSFVFPHDDRKPLMLISAGTGIAPFRAFLQDLEHEQEESGEQNHREAYLFYGCRRREIDYLYGEDIDHAYERGYLDNLFVEFSDAPDQQKRYVQDALAEQGALVARHLVDRDGYVFVCGSLAMGRAVKHAIVDALREHSHFRAAADNGKSADDAETDAAKQFLTDCLAAGRVVTELW